MFKRYCYTFMIKVHKSTKFAILMDPRVPLNGCRLHTGHRLRADLLDNDARPLYKMKNMWNIFLNIFWV